jgi:hypothetical protein
MGGDMEEISRSLEAQYNNRIIGDDRIASLTLGLEIERIQDAIDDVGGNAANRMRLNSRLEVLKLMKSERDKMVAEGVERLERLKN